jgi:hypothetical protein
MPFHPQNRLASPLLAVVDGRGIYCTLLLLTYRVLSSRCPACFPGAGVVLARRSGRPRLGHVEVPNPCFCAEVYFT